MSPFRKVNQTPRTENQHFPDPSADGRQIFSSLPFRAREKRTVNHTDWTFRSGLNNKKAGTSPAACCCKQDSVPASAGFCHFSGTRITPGLWQPTHRSRTSSPYAVPKQRSSGIFGLATHKVYPLRWSPTGAVSSYLTFSPLPRRSVAVIFCGTGCDPVAGAPSR